MEQPTEEQLLIINCVLYDTQFQESITNITTRKAEDGDHSPVTVLEWANAWTPDSSKDYSDKNGPGGTSMEDWNRLIATIKANSDVYGNMAITDTQQRASGANMAAITYGDHLIIGYEGTHGPLDWNDNGVGAQVDVTDTPGQQEAMDYYREQTAAHGDGSTLFVTGHSKGGNLARYVTIVAAAEERTTGQVYAFDGQGFSEAFHQKYADQIAQLKAEGVFHSSAAQIDMVHILLFGLDQDTVYRQGPTYSIDQNFGINHSPWSMLDWHTGTTQEGNEGELRIADVSEQNRAMSETRDALDYLFKFMSPADRENLVTMVMDLMADPEKMNEFIRDSDASTTDHLYRIGFERATIGSLFQPPYDETIDRLIPLLAAYAASHGIQTKDLIAIIDSLLPGFGPAVTAVLAYVNDNTYPSMNPWGGPVPRTTPSLLEYMISQAAASVPYSASVRDFSEETLNRMINIIATVEEEPFWDVRCWDVWYRFENEESLQGVDFSTNSAELTAYYRKIIDLKGITQIRMRQIFATAKLEDHDFESRILRQWICRLTR